MRQLLRNAIKTPDGTILESRHRHDYRRYIDANGETYMVDGGLEYIRRSVNEEPVEELDIYTDDPHEVIREGFTWGSYGRDGNTPLHYIKLKDLTEEHIQAILRTQNQLPDYIRKVFEDELKWRMNEQD